MTTLTEPLLAGREAPRWWPHARSAASWLASLRHLSLLAVLAWTAHAHVTLALLLGAPVWLAWALPVAVDAYVLSSLRAWEVAPARRHRDLAWALVLDGVAVAGSHAATQLAPPAVVRAAIAALLGVVLVLVLWRVHALDVEVRQRAPRQRHQDSATVAAQVAEPAPAPHATVAPRRAISAPARHDDVTAELRQRHDAGMARAAATAEVVALELAPLRTVQRRAAEVWSRES